LGVDPRVRTASSYLIFDPRTNPKTLADKPCYLPTFENTYHGHLKANNTYSMLASPVDDNDDYTGEFRD
jgi:hypothetical protein